MPKSVHRIRSLPPHKPIDPPPSELSGKKVEEKKAFSFIDLLNGAIHVITRTPIPFKVRTPFVNAAVEGTEFYVGINENSTRLVVYEGRVTASNDYGSLALVGHEAAVAYADQPPQRETIVQSLDTVQWALYYPAIIDYHRNNNLSGEADIDNQLRQAEHLLSRGRVDEAHDVINQVLSSDTDNSDATALQAIIAVVQNNKEQALELASHAVEFDPFSVPAKLALSYAQQAHFKIDEALDSVQQAVDLDLQNALLWARLAELQMSVGEHKLALEAEKFVPDSGFMPYGDMIEQVQKYNRVRGNLYIAGNLTSVEAESVVALSDGHVVETTDTVIQLQIWYTRASKSERKEFRKWMIDQE